MGFTSSLRIKAEYNATVTTGTIGTASDIVNESYTTLWGEGTGANQVNQGGSYLGTLSASTDTHVLSAFASATGTKVFTKVKFIECWNTGSTTLKLTPGGSQPFILAFASDVWVRPGGLIIFVAPDATGFAVASGSADKFTVVAAGATTYKLIIEGV